MNGARALFVSGTGTDVGKTYVTALVAKSLREAGIDAGYYKAALSGIAKDEQGRPVSDASFVAQTARIPDVHEDLVAFAYETPVSPHLAARLEGGPVTMEAVREGFDRACGRHKLVLVEGSGGIVCPLRWDAEKRIMLEDVVREFGIPVLLVADAGLGTLNAIATTVAYMERAGLRACGIVLNRYREGDVMHEDNRVMAEALCGVPVVACVPEGATSLDADPAALAGLFETPAGNGGSSARR